MEWFGGDFWGFCKSAIYCLCGYVKKVGQFLGWWILKLGPWGLEAGPDPSILLFVTVGLYFFPICLNCLKIWKNLANFERLADHTKYQETPGKCWRVRTSFESPLTGKESDVCLWKNVVFMKIILTYPNYWGNWIFLGGGEKDGYQLIKKVCHCRYFL